MSYPAILLTGEVDIARYFRAVLKADTALNQYFVFGDGSLPINDHGLQLAMCLHLIIELLCHHVVACGLECIAEGAFRGQFLQRLVMFSLAKILKECPVSF